MEQTEVIEQAKGVIRAEAEAILGLMDHIGPSFCLAVSAIRACTGKIICVGIGKSGLIAQKIAATLSSVGYPSFFLHAGEARHGDLGAISPNDLVWLFSNSGETEEILLLLPHLSQQNIRTIGMTATTSSSLAKSVSIPLIYGNIQEPGPTHLVPTASAAAMLCLGDAVSIVLAQQKGLTTAQLADRHPGGNIGWHILPVKNVMRTKERNPVVELDRNLSSVLSVMTKTPGRPGCVVVVDSQQRLQGIFTDGDLRRLIEQDQLDPSTPIQQWMSISPQRIHADARIEEALQIFKNTQIDNLPVVDEEQRVVGLLDVQDLIQAEPL